MRPARTFDNLRLETSGFPRDPGFPELNSPTKSVLSDEGGDKYLRTIPRKVSHLNLSELESFDTIIENLTSQQASGETHFTMTERNERFTRQHSNTDIQRLNVQSESIYRKIKYSSIPIAEKLWNEEEETKYACGCLLDIMDIREKYIFKDHFLHQHPLVNSFCDIQQTPVLDVLATGNITFGIVDGVYVLFHNEQPVPTEVVPVNEFYSDLELILEATTDSTLKSFCEMRLKLLDKKFDMHLMFNAERETVQCSALSKDFYNVIKIDNHVHLAACMNQKHLQKFMKNKLLTEPDEVVAKLNGETRTLGQVFESIGITPRSLNIDVLNCFAERIFNRFDRFNNKYNPVGQPLLREIFLKVENHIGGRYFAEICREVFNRLEDEKYLLSEYRVSIYGRKYNEWENLANWFIQHNLQSKNVGWLIQIPRLFKVYRSTKAVENFQQMLVNIFGPLFEATLKPENFPLLHDLLQNIVGFDSVDDESQMEKITSYSNYQRVTPDNWTAEENPTYSYWSYYLYANMFVLNTLRRARGLNTFSFRPHCGEAESKDHLATAFLTAHSINHGIELRHDPVLLYLFYLKQIGLSLSPVSNNKLFLKFLHTPFPRFFKIGLNVALSTDDPLMLHLTKEPLLEEYSVVAQSLNLSIIDLCEIARNSVLQSNFEIERKRHWLGDCFLSGKSEDQDSNRTNVPWIRYSYRYDNFHEEMNYILKHSSPAQV